MNISADNATIASIDNSGVVCVWHSSDGSLIARWSNVAEDNNAKSDDAAPAVFMSPDKQYCAASLNGTTMAWRLSEPSPVYTYKLKGSRVMGWSDAPLALQIYTGTEKPSETIRQRQVIQFPQGEEFDYMVSWEPHKNAEHQYTLSTVTRAGERKRPQWIGTATYTLSTGDANVSAGTFILGTKIIVVSLESHSRHVDAYSSSVNGQLGIRPYSFGANKFAHLTSNGYLRLWESGEKLYWTLPVKYSAKSKLSYSANRFWIADGKQIHVLDGTPRSLSKRDETPWLRWVPDVTVYACLPGAFLLVIPVWLFVDRGIRMSHTAKWLVGALSISVGLTIITQIEAPVQWSPLHIPATVLMNLLVGVGIGALVLEPLRMVTVRKWKMPLAGAMFVLIAVLAKIVYDVWPKPWALESTPSEFGYFVEHVFAFLVLPVCFGVLLLVNRLRTPTIFNVPAWVRFAMWGHGSLFELLISSVFWFVIFGIGMAFIFNLFRLTPDMIQQNVSPYVIPFTALALTAACYYLAVAVWLIRHGGWETHVKNKLDGRESR